MLDQREETVNCTQCSRQGEGNAKALGAPGCGAEVREKVGRWEVDGIKVDSP